MTLNDKANVSDVPRFPGTIDKNKIIVEQLDRLTNRFYFQSHAHNYYQRPLLPGQLVMNRFYLTVSRIHLLLLKYQNYMICNIQKYLIIFGMGEGHGPKPRIF